MKQDDERVSSELDALGTIAVGPPGLPADLESELFELSANAKPPIPVFQWSKALTLGALFTITAAAVAPALWSVPVFLAFVGVGGFYAWGVKSSVTGGALPGVDGS